MFKPYQILSVCSISLCISSIVFAGQTSSSAFSTPLEKHYATMMIGKWTVLRTQHDTTCGMDNNALLASSPNTSSVKSYTITGTIYRKLGLGKQYLITKEKVRSNLGVLKTAKPRAEHIYLARYTDNNTGHAWVFSSSGKFYPTRTSQLQTLKNGGVRAVFKASDMLVYSDVYPKGNYELDITTYHVVNGKQVLVQTEKDLRIRK